MTKPIPPDDVGLAPGADGSANRPGKAAPANRSRVIRPASFMRFADATGPADWEPTAGNPAEWEPAAGKPTDWDSVDGSTEPTAADDNSGPVPPVWRGGYDMSADDYLNLADIGYIDYDTGDQDDRYIPPPIPPQPKLDPVARGAWAALLGGPGYLFLATLLGWQMPGWAQLAAIIAFVAGFVVLVSRLGDGPSRRDGPDQGAVV